MTTLGDKLKEAGIDLVLSNQEDDWHATTEQAFEDFCNQNRGQLVIAEDFRQWAGDRLKEPTHPNAWGARWRSLLQRGRLQPTNTVRSTKRPVAHARRSLCYRVL